MASDDVARLYDFQANTTIRSGQVDDELDQLITAMNGKFGRGVANIVTGNNTFSGNNTFQGSDTFSGLPTFSNASGIKTDTITERTSANGVSIDGVKLKDSGIIFADAGELTIATGAITITGTYHTVDTESDAASDDLDTINGGTDGKVIILQSEADARNIVVKHNTGNIFLAIASDFTLDTKEQSITLVYSGALSKWVEVARSKDVTLPSAATQAEQETGSSTSVYVTPGRQQYHPSAAKAWVNFNGTGTAAVNRGYNIASITDQGTGDYTFTFTTAFSDANYAWSTGNTQSSGNAAINVCRNINRTKSTTQFHIAAAQASTRTDVDDIGGIFLGDQ